MILGKEQRLSQWFLQMSPCIEAQRQAAQGQLITFANS